MKVRNCSRLVARKKGMRLDEATKLREEARALVASYERKRRDAEKEAEEIVAQAQEEATHMAEAAATALQ